VFGQFVLAAATYPMGHWTWMDPKDHRLASRHLDGKLASGGPGQGQTHPPTNLPTLYRKKETPSFLRLMIINQRKSKDSLETAATTTK